MAACNESLWGDTLGTLLSITIAIYTLMADRAPLTLANGYPIARARRNVIYLTKPHYYSADVCKLAYDETGSNKVITVKCFSNLARV